MSRALAAIGLALTLAGALVAAWGSISFWRRGNGKPFYQTRKAAVNSNLTWVSTLNELYSAARRATWALLLVALGTLLQIIGVFCGA